MEDSPKLLGRFTVQAGFCLLPFSLFSFFSTGKHDGIKGGIPSLLLSLFRLRPLLCPRAFVVRILYPFIAASIHCGNAKLHANRFLRTSHRNIPLPLRLYRWVSSLPNRNCLSRHFRNCPMKSPSFSVAKIVCSRERLESLDQWHSCTNLPLSLPPGFVLCPKIKRIGALSLVHPLLHLLLLAS